MHPAEPFFDSFVALEKRHRYKQLLSTTRGQKKIRLSLDHFKDLDMRFCHRMPSAQRRLAETLQTLKMAL